MASLKFRCSFKGFKWSPAGYREVQNSGSVQSRLSRYAESAAGGGNAAVNAHDHAGTHYEPKQVQGRFAKGYIVHPTTHEGVAHAADALGRYG